MNSSVYILLLQFLKIQFFHFFHFCSPNIWRFLFYCFQILNICFVISEINVGFFAEDFAVKVESDHCMLYTKGLIDRETKEHYNVSIMVQKTANRRRRQGQL